MTAMELYVLTFILLVLLVWFTTGVRTIRPTQKGLVERFGKFYGYRELGLTYIIPIMDHLIKVNVTEKMTNVASQEIITKDKLNATVAAQIYYKVKPIEESVKASQYYVNNVDVQIVALAQTTLRNIIGTMTLTEANSDRNKINSDLMNTLTKETINWGIEVVRSELREINPPRDVQDTMNKVVKAENEKTAANDFATAKETEADGLRRALIKEAEGRKQAEILRAEATKQAAILEAEGKSKAIEMVNTVAQLYFKGNAQLLRQLEVVENSLKQNSVFIVPEGQSLINVLNSVAGVNTSQITVRKEEETK